jgi:hypothetical protein
MTRRLSVLKDGPIRAVEGGRAGGSIGLLQYLGVGAGHTMVRVITVQYPVPRQLMLFGTPRTVPDHYD